MTRTDNPHDAQTRTTLGLVSDTHGWVHPYLHEAFAGVSAILHAGDLGTWDVLIELQVIAPVLAVRGNIDGGDLLDLPKARVETLAGKRIALQHIAGSVRSPKPAARRLIRENQADVFVCGHSHIPALGRVEGALWINPGAAGRQGFHKDRTAILLHIEADGDIKLDRVLLGGRTAPA